MSEREYSIDTLEPPRHSLFPILIMYTVSTIRMLHYHRAAHAIELHSSNPDELNATLGLDIDKDKHIWSSFNNVSNDAIIIYKVAMFDSFLNSVTRFALAMKPEKAIGQTQIHAGQLLSKTRSEVLQPLIDKRSNALSRESFATRINELESIIDERFYIDANTIKKLKNISKKRNFIVHEGDSFNFTIDNSLNVKKNADTRPDTSYTMDELDTLDLIGKAIYTTCVKKLLSVEMSNAEVQLLEAITLRPSPRDNEGVFRLPDEVPPPLPSPANKR